MVTMVVAGERTERARRLADRLRTGLRTGVLAFPLTPFSADAASVNPEPFRDHLRRHLDAGAGALFVCCGTGEFSALDEDEYALLTRLAVEEAGGKVPVLSGVGYGWAQARRFVRIADDAGVDGVLVLPHYLVGAPQAGLVAHFRRIAEVSELPLMVYQRGLMRVQSATLAEIGAIPTVFGLKDGHGDLLAMHEMVLSMPEEFLFFNGALTAEVQHKMYSSIGVHGYSSAFHSCAPEVSKAFFDAYWRDDKAMVDQLLREVFFPFVELRSEVPGYAVALIKAAARLRGEEVGPVRAPLQDPDAADVQRLESIIRHGLNLVGVEF